MVVREHPRSRSAVTAQNLGGEQAVRAGTVGETRRNGSGHRAARVLQPDARRVWLLSRHPHRNAPRVSPGRLEDNAPHARSAHTSVATDFAARVASSGSGVVSEIRTGG